MRESKANKRVINTPITQTLSAAATAAMRVINPPVKTSGIVSCSRPAIGDKRRQEEKKKKKESRTQAEIFFCFFCSSAEMSSVWQSERDEATRQRQNQRNVLLERSKGKTVRFNGGGKKRNRAGGNSTSPHPNKVPLQLANLRLFRLL